MTLETWIPRANAVFPAGTTGNFDATVLIKSAKGSRLWDQDGREYIDYLIGSGPMILGHCHPEIDAEITAQMKDGLTFFANNTFAIELAEEICTALPCADMLRYVSTGGEADMYAMRLARAFTGRDKIVKFEGGYHGMSAEALMSLAPDTLVNFPLARPDSAGIPKAVADNMLIAPFNDAAAACSLIAEHGHDIAAVIVEPLQRLIPPAEGFLQALRDACTAAGIVLIFDEVVTGFRLAYGGAQAHYGVTPDLATVGKIIGGGFPLAAVVGRRDIMAHFDKSAVGAERWLIQLGTLSGNPMAARAGLKTLEILRRAGSYERLYDLGESIMRMYDKHLSAQGLAFQIVGHPTLFDVVFSDSPIRNYRDIFAADAGKNTVFNTALREGGLLKSPAKLYPSLALTAADLEQTEAAIEHAAKAVAGMRD